MDSVEAIATLKDKCSPEEWQARVDLAALYRLTALERWDDLIFTHISARIPGPDHHFLINPYGMLFEEITASSLLKVDLEGALVEPSDFIVNPAGFTIHSAVHEAREDAHYVIHLHTDQGVAVSAQKNGLLPISQSAMIALHDLAYHDYEGVALDLDERERIVNDIGDKNALMLRNHGTLTVGATAGAAWQRMFILERACKMQIMAQNGGELNMCGENLKSVVASQTPSQLMDMMATQLTWPALLRKLRRMCPEFEN